jgi:hypothetical protein
MYLSDASRHRVISVSSTGAVTTVAGNGTAGYSGDNGPATLAALSRPSGVALDAAGNLYIADAGNSRVRQVSPSGTISTVAGTGSAGFSGDGGAATAATLRYPSALATDSGGNLYVADGMDNRIRRVGPQRIFVPRLISTVAGDGEYGYSGDGGLATAAHVGWPRSLTVDGAGRVYVTTLDVVRLLTPGCAVSAAPNSLNAPAAGETLTLTIQAGTACSWTITGLPAWVTASATSGTGSATVTLTLAANLGVARSESFTAAGTAVTVNQAGNVACTYVLNPARQTFPAAGGVGSIAVSTALVCPWTAVSSANWATITSGAAGSGNGTVNYEVAANSGAARTATITIGGTAFPVEQQGQAAPGPSGGIMAQVASGGGWKTTFTLVNNGGAAALARLTFTGTIGADLVLPLSFPQTGAPPVLASTLERTLAPNTTLIVETEGPASQAVQQGWAQLTTDGAVTGFAVFCQVRGVGEQEAVVPLEARSANAYVLAFDNTGSFETGVAVANLAPQAGSITVVIADDTGAQMQTTRLDLPARGHTAFQLSSLYAATVRKRGTIEFRTQSAGQISVLGLRFNPKGSFTTIPVMAK